MVEALAPIDIAQALASSRGNRAEAARKLGVTYQTIMRYEKMYLEIADVREATRESLVDLAEDGLYELVKQKRWSAIQFTLSTLGRQRGYGNVTRHEYGEAPEDDIDLSDPRVRAIALEYAERLADATIIDGEVVNKGEVESRAALDAPKQQDSGDASEAPSVDGVHAAETREE